VLLPWLELQGFKSLLQRFTGELGEATEPVAPAATPAPPKKAEPVDSKPAPSTAPRSNQPFSADDYELIHDEKALD
jgi:DNA polymerase-1